MELTRRNSLLLILLLLPFLSTAQKVEEKVFLYVDNMPEFPGGTEKMREFISKNLLYPDSARDVGLEGNVLVSFIVDRRGRIRDIVVTHGLCGQCDAAVVRVIKKMPRWKPGSQNGKMVSVKYFIPISFKLNN